MSSFTFCSTQFAHAIPATDSLSFTAFHGAIAAYHDWAMGNPYPGVCRRGVQERCPHGGNKIERTFEMDDNLYVGNQPLCSWFDDPYTMHLMSFLFGIANRDKKRDLVDLGKPPNL